MPYAMATTVKPNASATPRKPTAPPANIAVPQPPSTSTTVPMNSHKYFFMIIKFFYTNAKLRNFSKPC